MCKKWRGLSTFQSNCTCIVEHSLFLCLILSLDTDTQEDPPFFISPVHHHACLPPAAMKDVLDFIFLHFDYKRQGSVTAVHVCMREFEWSWKFVHVCIQAQSWNRQFLFLLIRKWFFYLFVLIQHVFRTLYCMYIVSCILSVSL